MKNFYKTTISTLCVILFVSCESQSIAADSGKKELGNVVGLVDSYKVNCAATTTHLDFKLMDATNVSLLETESSLTPQFINAHLTKTVNNKKIVVDVTKISPNDSKELILKGGNGAYQLTLDTLNTNLKITKAQNYTVQYRCLNANGKATTPTTGGLKTGIESAIKTLANKQTTKFTFTCAKNQKLGDTQKIYVKVSNKLKVNSTEINSVLIATNTNSPTLSAQLYKDIHAVNANDAIVDTNYGEKVTLNSGAGDYRVYVNTSATNKSVDNAKTYSFQYNCLDDKNIEQTATLSQLEDK